MTTSCVPLLLLLVLPVEVDHHDGSGDDDDATVSDVDGMSLDVSGPVGPGVDEGTTKRTRRLVSKHQMLSDCITYEMTPPALPNETMIAVATPFFKEPPQLLDPQDTTTGMRG